MIFSRQAAEQVFRARLLSTRLLIGLNFSLDGERLNRQT